VKMQTYHWRKDIKDDDSLLPLKNGVMNWRTGVFEQYDPSKHRFFFQIPVDYISSAECPRTMKFLESLVEPADVEVLIEIAAYCLYRKNIKRAVVLVGGKDAGKTMYVEFLRTFLGEENTCTVPIQWFSRHKNATALLEGKMANIYDDLSARALDEVGEFKALTGGGRVPSERKYKDPSDFKPYTKHIFACNDIPKPLRDDSEGYFGRLRIVLFPFTFVNHSPAPGSSERQGIGCDELRAILSDINEMSGFLNAAMARMPKVVKAGLSDSPSSTELIETYVRQSNSLAGFLREGCESVPGARIAKPEFYNAYKIYCEEVGLDPEHVNYVGQLLPRLDPRIREQRDGVDPSDPHKSRPRFWKGIRLKATSQPSQSTYPYVPAYSQHRTGVLSAIVGSGLGCTPCADIHPALQFPSRTIRKEAGYARVKAGMAGISQGISCLPTEAEAYAQVLGADSVPEYRRSSFQMALLEEIEKHCERVVG
ncbi:MAG: phage/plasmid primase, P4 family, partial [Thermoplasmatota archaeon]